MAGRRGRTGAARQLPSVLLDVTADDEQLALWIELEGGDEQWAERPASST